MEGPNKPAEIEMECDPSVSGLCWWCWFTEQGHRQYKEKHRNFIVYIKHIDLEANTEKTKC